jgi:hypothetical protein
MFVVMNKGLYYTIQWCAFLFLQIFPAGLSNQITLIFLINMKNLKSDFFYEYNSYAKMTGNECLCCNSTVKPRK